MCTGSGTRVWKKRGTRKGEREGIDFGFCEIKRFSTSAE